MTEEELHRRLQAEAVSADGEAHRALLDADDEAAARAFAVAAATYAASWTAAPPGAFGRLVGWMKAAELSGDDELAAGAARDVLRTLAGADGADGSPAAAWARALASLRFGDDADAVRAATTMESGSPAFGRAAAAVRAIVAGDGGATTAALDAIAADFETRDEHLTGVAIADTALVLHRLAVRRGLPGASPSPLLPGAT